MTEDQKTVRKAAARYVEAKRKLEERDYTNAELAKLIPPYRRAMLALLEACVPVGETELAAEKVQQTQTGEKAA